MKLFVERPIATAMVFLVLLVLGAYSFFNIPIEMAQQQEFPQLDIMTTWYGVAPEIVQTEITAILEEKVATVKGVRKITSSSSIGDSRITLEFDEKTNMEFARLALREKIAEIEALKTKYTEQDKLLEEYSVQSYKQAQPMQYEELASRLEQSALQNPDYYKIAHVHFFLGLNQEKLQN